MRAIVAIAAATVFAACAAWDGGNGTASSRKDAVTAEANGSLVTLHNGTPEHLEAASSVTLDVFEDGRWVDGGPLIAQLGSKLVVAATKARVVSPDEDVTFDVEYYDELPPGRYRFRVGYAVRGSSVRSAALASFEKRG